MGAAQARSNPGARPARNVKRARVNSRRLLMRSSRSFPKELPRQSTFQTAQRLPLRPSQLLWVLGKLAQAGDVHILGVRKTSRAFSSNEQLVTPSLTSVYPQLV